MTTKCLKLITNDAGAPALSYDLPGVGQTYYNCSPEASWGLLEPRGWSLVELCATSDTLLEPSWSLLERHGPCTSRQRVGISWSF